MLRSDTFCSRTTNLEGNAKNHTHMCLHVRTCYCFAFSDGFEHLMLFLYDCSEGSIVDNNLLMIRMEVEIHAVHCV